MPKILTNSERISKIVEKWYILEPLYFVIWTTHDLCLNVQIATIRTGKGKIEYNPNFVHSLTDAQLEEVLKVEMLRILLQHPYSRKQELPKLAYLASNITIAEYLPVSIPLPRAMTLFGDKKHLQQHFEYYYQLLLENKDNNNEKNAILSEKEAEISPEKNNEKPENKPEKPSEKEDKKEDKKDPEKPEKEEDEDEAQKPENPSPQSENTAPDFPSKNENNIEKPQENIESYADETQTGRENTDTWDADEFMSTLLKEKIEEAQHRHSWGSISGKLQAQILANLKPKIDYRSILRAFRMSVLATSRTLTRMKPSRRYDFEYMGSRRDFCTKLLFAVDVSGSVSNHDVKVAFSIVNRFFRYGVEGIDVIQFDEEIKGKPEIFKKARKKVDIIGRGGTNFAPLMDYLDENRQYDGLIIFTDGFAYPPNPSKNQKTKVLWLFNTEENYTAVYPQLKHLGKGAFVKE